MFKMIKTFEVWNKNDITHGETNNRGVTIEGIITIKEILQELNDQPYDPKLKDHFLDFLEVYTIDTIEDQNYFEKGEHTYYCLTIKSNKRNIARLKNILKKKFFKN